MNKRLLVQSIVLIAIFIASAVLMRDSKNSDAFFTILVACYGTTIAVSGKSDCLRRFFSRK